MSGVQDTHMTEADNNDGGVTLNFDVQNAVSDAVASAMNTKSEELKVMMNDKFDELKALISTKQGTSSTPSSSAGPSTETQTVIENGSDPSASDSHVKAVVVKASVHPPKAFTGESDDVEHFLRKMKQYLCLTQIPANQHLEYAATYLEGQPDRLWSSERETLVLAKAPDALTWSDFEAFLQSNFGKLAPMTDYFKEYENLKQESTVIDYVSRLKTCVSKLKNTFLEPSEGTVVVKFLRGLRTPIAKLVQESAPDGWWTSSDQVFAKALTFETNKAAMMSTPQTIPLNVDKLEGEKRKAEAQPKSDKGAKKQKPNPDKAVKIPDSEFKRRQKAKRCVMCGKERHGTCHNKDATPFVQ